MRTHDPEAMVFVEPLLAESVKFCQVYYEALEGVDGFGEEDADRIHRNLGQKLR